MISFKILDKNEFNKISKKIYYILHKNMSLITPTGNTFEFDYREWFNAVSEGLKQVSRNIILFYFDDILIGFFQYYTNKEGIFMMEEIQITPSYQGKKYNVFRELFSYLFSILPASIKKVQAFAHKKNQKSISILHYMGLNIIGENKRGDSYHFEGTYDKFMNWYYSQ